MKKQNRRVHGSKSSSVICPFEHHYVLTNRNYWAKAKKWFRRYDKHILNRQDKEEIQQQIQDHEDFLLDCAIEDDELDNYMSFLQEQIEKRCGDYDSLTDEEWKFYNSHYEWWKNYRKELFCND